MGARPFFHGPSRFGAAGFSSDLRIYEAPRISQDETEPRRLPGAEGDLAARVGRLAQRAAASAQVDLAWIEIKGPQSGRRVRVFIERRGGVPGLADCERVNEKLSALLDLEDPIPGSYTLEVSTAGLDRPLRSVEECGRFLGRRVRVKHRNGNRSETEIGRLSAVETGVLCLEGPEGARRIAWSAVLAARLDPDLEALFGGHRGGRRRHRT